MSTVSEDSIRGESSMDNWYPRLESTTVPTPYTVRVDAEKATIHEGTIHELTLRLPNTDDLREAVLDVGGPDAFFRTDQASEKHKMDSASRIRRLDESHLRSVSRSLGESNLMKGIGGLPYESFYVREWLDLHAEFTAFDGLKIASELRFFILDGEIHDHGFYWPEEAIRQPNCEGWREKIEATRNHALAEAETHPEYLAEIVAEEFDSGYWSLDFAETVDGTWYAIDMARGEASWHPESCEKPEAIVDE